MGAADEAVEVIGIDLQAGRRVVVERTDHLAVLDRLADQIVERNRAGVVIVLVVFWIMDVEGIGRFWRRDRWRFGRQRLRRALRFGEALPGPDFGGDRKASGPFRQFG